MKLRELLPCVTSELWITLAEDPNNSKPEITMNLTSGSDWREVDIFSDQFLDEPVHLMKAERNDVVFISLGYKGEE